MNEQAKKMLKAKLECLKRETSGMDIDCNYRNCDECNLCYEQGNVGEQKEALDMAIKALEQKSYKSEARRWKMRYLDLKQRIFKLEEQTSWIPVSEKLPEKRDCYLVTIKWKGKYSRTVYTGIDVVEYEVKTKKWNRIYGKVIAWMSLPQPYKAESEPQESEDNE